MIFAIVCALAFKTVTKDNKVVGGTNVGCLGFNPHFNLVFISFLLQLKSLQFVNKIIEYFIDLKKLNNKVNDKGHCMVGE